MTEFNEYMATLAARDQALLAVGGLVVVGLFYWYLLDNHKLARRWGAWLAVAITVASMLAGVMIGG